MAGLRLAASLPRQLVLAGALLLAACQPASPPFHGADISGAEYGQKWQLNDTEGKPRTLADYHGQVLLVYFGFTHCPDICPVTLGHLQSALQQLGPAAEQVRVLFVTVDAENDTVAALHDYLAHFGPRFIGLTGSADALAAAARDFRVYAQKLGSDKGIAFEHAGFVYALDRQGKPRVLYGPEVPAQDISADLKRLLGS
ncbi:MAG: SCO family protein [Pseudomonadota bacterium]|nr:SCO family protein [Pseudomonadota bacterium]